MRRKIIPWDRYHGFFFYFDVDNAINLQYFIHMGIFIGNDIEVVKLNTSFKELTIIFHLSNVNIDDLTPEKIQNITQQKFDKARKYLTTEGYLPSELNGWNISIAGISDDPLGDAASTHD